MRSRRALAPLLVGIAACALIVGTGARVESGWLVTVYYTPVESYHHDEPVPVTGCPRLDCTGGDAALGMYPRSFVDAVRNEGTGRITDGPHAGAYLNWSANVGYWLDTSTRDAYGDPLDPLRSAAADGLPRGTEVRVSDCGNPEGSLPDGICDRLRSGRWRITDRFTPGLGGDRHIDLYIGEEDRPDFTDSPLYLTLHDATLHIAPSDGAPDHEAGRDGAAGSDRPGISGSLGPDSIPASF